MPSTNCTFPAQRVTNETYRWVSDARFHPSGKTVIATKWYTSERSLGAGEGWEYEVPSIDELRLEKSKQIGPGSGTRLVSRTLPLGWTSEDYGDQQIGPEQLLWHGKDSIVFSKNVIDSSTFTYSKGKNLHGFRGYPKMVDTEPLQMSILESMLSSSEILLPGPLTSW